MRSRAIHEHLDVDMPRNLRVAGTPLDPLNPLLPVVRPRP